MKKSELTQLTQLIEILVAKEVRKQLPQLIGEVFANMAGKSMVTENVNPTPRETPRPVEEPEHLEMKESLRELFAGSTPVTRAELEEGVKPRPTIRYAKDPILNQILNETTPDLRKREGMAGMAAAMHSGYGGGYSTPGSPTMGAGPMMSESELPSFARGQRELPTVPPPSAAPAEVIREDHVPLSNIPDGVSVLDVARVGAGVIAAPVQEALTNYDRMKKILEASKGKRY